MRQVEPMHISFLFPRYMCALMYVPAACTCIWEIFAEALRGEKTGTKEREIKS